MTGGIGLLLAVLVLVAIWLTVEYVGWRRRDQDTRLARLRTRGLA